MAKADAFEDILKKGVVRIATPLDVPPFGSQNEERKPEGFDIELAGTTPARSVRAQERRRDTAISADVAEALCNESLWSEPI